MSSEPVTVIVQKCPLCGSKEAHSVPTRGFLLWRHGMLIQRALPDLNECIREFLITGFCADCRAENDRIAEEAERSEAEGDYEEAF